MSRLPEEQKLKIVKTFILGKYTISQLAHQYNFSRTTLYEWVKQYKMQGRVANQIVRGKSHPRTLNFHLEQRLWELVSNHPAKSIGELDKLKKTRGIKIGRHGLQNFLVRNSLNTREKRLQWAQKKLPLFDTRAKGRLTGRDRLHYIKEILAGIRTVTSIARETGVSRFSLYEWLNKYKKGGGNEASLAPRFRKSSDHYKYLPEIVVNQILDTVIVSPDTSLTKLYLKVNTAGVKVGRHGVQNVLARYNLNTLESRRLYAQKFAGFQKIVPRTHDAGRIVPLIEQLTPNLLPAPPPSLELRRASPPEASPSLRDLFFIFLTSFRSFSRQLITLPLKQGNALKAAIFAFSLPVILSLTTLGIWNYLKIFIDSPSFSVSIGYFFASIALGLGMFFFLYSFKYYASVVLVLMFSRQIPHEFTAESVQPSDHNSPNSPSYLKVRGLGGVTSSGLIPDISSVTLDRHPFVSIHLPLFNEKRVVNRLLEAVTSMDYDNFEVIVADDSTDETKDIVLEWKNHPKIKISHRDTRQGFKGGALREALTLMDKRTEFVLVFDSDFLPYPDTITQFLKYFKATCGTLDFGKTSCWTPEREARWRIASPDQQGDPIGRSRSLQDDTNYRIAAIQGYQWHVLNKSENWITRGVRSEYAGSYVVERSGAEIYGGLKQIAGSVYMIRADVLNAYGWGDSITEDFELTLKLYRDGYKVVYTPYIQAPSECVSTIKRLVRQRMRWAEGHSHNIKRLFWNILLSNKTEKSEKFEFLYLSPYYLQSFLFLIGTLFWFLSETVFHVRLPFWTAVWGWSLVLTNMLSLPLMNVVGMFLEEAEEKDFLGIVSFVLLTYIVAPFQAYASVKGFLEKEEGPWFRTPKTGKITDIYKRGRFYRWLTGIFGQPSQAPSLTRSHLAKLNANQSLALTNSTFRSELEFNVSHSPKRRRHKWLGNAIIALVLILAIVINHTAQFVKEVDATSPRVLTVEEQSRQETQPDLPAASSEPMGKPTVFTYDTQKGRLEQIFHREPRVRIKLGKWEFETVTVGATGLDTVKHNPPLTRANQVIYPEIFAGIDLKYTSKTGRLTEEFILREYQPVEDIQSLIRMVGVEPTETQGRIVFVDETSKEEIFTFSPPFMHEIPANSLQSSAIRFEDLQNSGVNYSLGIEYEMHQTPLGWQLTKQLTEEGKKWLADPERQFPVIIDPSVIVSTGIVDADVQFGGLQRKVAFVNGDWYAFHNDGGQPLYKKSADGVTWESNVNVDATEADTDNFNSSIWVKGNVIWVVWIDDSSEDIEFRSIDTTADADTLGTKCTSNLGVITIGSTNTVSIAVQNTGTDIYVAQSDTGADTEVHILQATSGCTFTDRTTGSGLTAGDRPVLVRNGDDALVVFQDGNVSYSHWNASDLSWVASNITVSADTDTTYSVTSDGTTAWVLVQSGTTATTFYRLGQFERTIDTGTGLNKAHVDIDCPATDNCKILYMDIAGGAGAIALKFVDCNDAACSAPTITEADGSAGATAFAGPLALDCPAPDDCKYAYFEGDPERLAVEDCDNEACSTQGATAVDAGPGMDIPSYVDIYCLSTTLCKVVYVQSGVNDLKFVNCTGAATNVCATNANNILDADVGELGGFPSVFCPTDTDCKVVYYDANTNGSILFADCNAAACTSTTLDATSTLDSNVGIGDTVFVSLNCSAAATECRVVYYDGTDNDVTFVDCAADADCSPANCDTPTNCTDIDSDVGTIGSPVRVDCDGGGNPPTDCKVLYYDGTDQDVTFVDCGSEDCATNTTTDIDTDVGPDSAFVGIDCSLGATPTDCRIAYNDGSDNDITYVDCEDGDCSAPDSSRDIDSAVESEYPFLSMDCGSDSANCKLVYHDTTEQDLTFVDCNDETCSAPAASDIDSSVGRVVVATSIDCPASGNCKVVYVDYLVSTLFFVDCNDESCSAPPAPTTIDSGILRGTNRNSIDCPTAGDCKIVYHDDSEADMTYVDCNDETCSAPSAVDLDTSVSGNVLVSNDIDCTLGATDCRIVFFDKSANTYTHVDCGGGTPTDCSTNTQLVLNTDTPSTSQQDGGVNIECFSGATTDCKVAFHEEDIDDITFIDCATTSCCTNINCTGVGETATVTTIDADVDGAGGGGNNYLVMGVSLACASASECALIYKDLPDATYYFVDCDNASCSTRTTVPLTTMQGAGGAIGVMDCLTDNTNCKIFYGDGNNSRVRFTDCIGDTCNLATLTAPWTGQTNVLGVSISYDSTNDDIYAHIIMDATEQAYFKSTDASTISWSAQASYGFATGDLNHISAPMSGAGSTQIGVTLRQTANYEFAAVPESWWTIVVGGIAISGWLGRQKYRRIRG